ncbi:MAG: NUDIX domain-containing protein [Lachnospiraceae bacterium]|nr:NUDIX domain-containing protein [Lachnospiraceae bacterium]
MEIWDGYLIDGTLANYDLVRGKPIPKGLYHLVSEILVRHIDGDYLLMKRDLRKSNYGGYYEATAGGSALKGEDKVSCARRELLEETGISSDAFKEIGQYTSHDTIYYIFMCITDCDKSSISLQKGETISYKWISENDFIAFVNSSEMIDAQRKRYHDFFVKMGYIH